ncbi:MAG: ATP-binding cassette domain-containing protein [candidate division Zixibacteria bacterium]|nr:ATP-binding cassette domain-containing protein [candidate division Zixibacteria bacterium]
MNSASPILKVNNLCRTINIQNQPKSIIDNFSFEFKKSTIYNIIGASGSGKSSLLRLLNRLDEPTGGQIIFDGKDYREYPPCSLRQKIGYLFQVPYLFQGTIYDNLKYANPKLTEENISELAAHTRIDDKLLTSNVENLSIGEKQRVSLARILTIEPVVMLLDEPTSALDPANTAAIENLIKNIALNKRLAVIMVTHDPQQALRMGGEALLLDEGKLAEWGTCEDVINNPQTEIGHHYKNKGLK